MADMHDEQAEERLDLSLLEKMAQTWPKRATVRADLYKYSAEYIDPERPDYPVELIPFAQHPRYLATSPETKRRVETWAWLVYNERCVQSEEQLANPAFSLIMNDGFAGTFDIAVRKSIQQCLIDEHFHSLIHLTAIHETRKWRKLEEHLDCPQTIMYRRMEELRAGLTDPWERSCLSLVYGTVAEVSIKAFLDLIAESDKIQPAHSMIALVHNRDEAAHGQVMVPVTKILWRRLNEKQRRFYLSALPAALEAFTIHDFSAWRAILDHEHVAGAAEIIGDMEAQALAKKKLVRDMSGLRKLATELDILDQIDFEFETSRPEPS
jgi:hypothetical protein